MKFSPENAGPERSTCRPSGNQMATRAGEAACLPEAVPVEPGAGKELGVCSVSQHSHIPGSEAQKN